MTRIFLVRHAEPENPDGLIYGMRDGFPLSDRGRRQAAALAEGLGPLVGDSPVIVSSPASRARQTAEAISRACGGMAVETDERLREWRLGGWEGKKVEEFYAESGYLEDPSSVVTEESFDAMAARVREAVEALAERVRGGVGIVVSHREPMVAALLSLRGRPPRESLEMSFPVASAWEIVYTDDAREPEVRKALDRHDVK